MRIIENLSLLRGEKQAYGVTKQAYAVTLGKFDGLHLGHQAVLEILREEALREGLQTLVISFLYEHRHEGDTALTVSSPYVCSREERECGLASWGIDVLLYLRFEEIRQLDYRQFLEQLQEHINIGAFVGSDKLQIGYSGTVSSRGAYDEGPSAAKRGGMEEITQYFSAQSICTRVIRSLPLPSLSPSLSSSSSPSLTSSSTTTLLSTTKIKGFLQVGRVDRVRKLQRLPYSLSGQVMRGKGLGRKLGYPTANFHPEAGKFMLQTGTYLTAAWIMGELYASLTFIGIPGVGGGEDQGFLQKSKKIQLVVETFLFSFTKSVYNIPIHIYFLRYLRDNISLDSAVHLQSLIQKDEKQARDWFDRADTKVVLRELTINLKRDSEIANDLEADLGKISIL